MSTEIRGPGTERPDQPADGGDRPGTVGSGAPDSAVSEAPNARYRVEPEGIADDRIETRLARWQRKLLDLSLHNRLLNFKPTRRSLELRCPDAMELAEKLQSGARIKIVPAPAESGGEPGAGREDAENRRRSIAGEALRRNEVAVDMEGAELAGRLIELYRTARSDLQEGGANTLFLVLGFLKWTRDDKGERTFRAPLVLVPVALQRRSVRSGVRMVLHEDEPRFNTTLLEMLRQDFGMDVKGLDESLPVDGGGVDLRGLWERMRREVHGIEGFEVVEGVVLGTFSFAKYLMWKDLVDRSDRILGNRAVGRLIRGPGHPFDDDEPFPQPASLDEAYPPDSLLTGLPADSSQLSAIAACARQGDFVLIGPPGTGKSQTIANMISHTLAEGRTVLFVSEKAAALEVVYKRLKSVGLGEFCLELHSNKARKVDVLEQLRSAWNSEAGLDDIDWRRESRNLKDSRDALNRYVEHIHRRYRNGLTPFLAMGRVVHETSQPSVELSWPSMDAHDQPALARLRDIARKMDVYGAEAVDVADATFAAVQQPDWSPAWQRSLVSLAAGIVAAVSESREALAAFFGGLRLEPRKLTLDQLRALKLLAATLPRARGRSLQFAFERGALHVIAALDEGVGLLQEYRRLERRLSVRCADRESGGTAASWQDARKSWWPESEPVRRRIRDAMMARGGLTGKSEFGADLKLLWRLRAAGEKLAELEIPGRRTPAWRGVDTALEPLKRDLLVARRLLYAVAALGTDGKSLTETRAAVRELIVDGGPLLDPAAPVGRLCTRLSERLQELESLIEPLSAAIRVDVYEHVAAGPGDDWLEQLKKLAADLVAKESRLNAWCAWRRVRDEAADAGLGPLAAAVERGDVAPGKILRCFEYSYCRWWATEVVQNDAVLREFHSAEREDRIREFRDLDRRFIELTRRHIRAGLCARLRQRCQAAPASEFSVLRRELEKKTRHKPLRRLIGEIPSAIASLTPCLLMSPLSVAQYLSPEQSTFDLVIFDEASQITVWDAVGAIARGRQTVVVGDPRQLPPTSFFSRSDDDPEDGDDAEGDLESVLDECLGAGLPALNLEWHYRSEHESLIAFSNHRYYGGRLITFPSPLTYDRAVRRRLVADGVYGRGGTRTNRAEARAVVAEVVKRLRSPSFVASKRSIGVVTFNVEQQRLIEDLLDEERLGDPSIERFFSEDHPESLFVKNLESVQGDERDMIFFSVTFGPDAEGHVSMNFGPLNRDGGERRLNVAITRARSELLVFTSLGSEQIDLSRARGAGVRDFKGFLEFAERGSRALAESIYGSVGEYASPFEGAVARSLSERGWVVHPQIGVSEFRISLGIVHPDSPGRYLAGVECDGQTYRRSATARDRDKLREEVLSRIGWDIVRVWSVDWWLDEKRAAQKLDLALCDILEQARAEAEAERMSLLHESLRGSFGADSESVSAARPAPASSSADRQHPLDDSSSAPSTAIPDAGGARVESSPGLTEMDSYRACDPAQAASAVDTEKFFDKSQDDAISQVIASVVAAEGPVRDELLVKRVVRAHGFKRTGRKLRDRVLALAAPRYQTTHDAGGVFFWPDGASPQKWGSFRAPVSEDDFRSADEICFEELAVLARRILAIGAEDPAREMALETGLARLDSGTRRRLEDVITRLASAPGVDPGDP